MQQKIKLKCRRHVVSIVKLWWTPKSVTFEIQSLKKFPRVGYVPSIFGFELGTSHKTQKASLPCLEDLLDRISLARHDCCCYFLKHIQSTAPSKYKEKKRLLRRQEDVTCICFLIERSINPTRIVVYDSPIKECSRAIRWWSTTDADVYVIAAGSTYYNAAKMAFLMLTAGTRLAKV
jgi:hypothetical protein